MKSRARTNIRAFLEPKSIILGVAVFYFILIWVDARLIAEENGLYTVYVMPGVSRLA